MKKVAYRLGLGIAVLAAVTSLSVSTASAATTTTAAKFAAQARELHLTAAQRASLQHSVDAVVARTGGVQVDINRISIPGGEILLPMPGNAHAPGLQPLTDYSCPYQYFCVYQGQTYTGGVMKLFYCSQDDPMPWVGLGIYDNNQSGGAVARFKNSSHTVIGYSKAPQTGPQSIDWSPIYYVQPC